MNTNASDFIAPVKDEEAAHPVASQWRPTLSRIVGQLAKGDYSSSLGLGPSVHLPKEAAEQIRRYLDNFGQSLTDLPDATWATSVAQWQLSYWELIVDLWTLESGKSDLVLNARVYEEDAHFRFAIHAIYVP
jgi:hypothetical protein